MAILESAPGDGKFFASNSTTIGNGALACNDPCALGGHCSIAVGIDFWDNAHTSDSSNRGKRLGGKLNTLVQRAQHMGGSSDG